MSLYFPSDTKKKSSAISEPKASASPDKTSHKSRKDQPVDKSPRRARSAGTLPNLSKLITLALLII